MKAILRGPSGHGSVPIRGGAMAKLSRLLQKLDKRRLPVHITPVARQMIKAMTSALPFPSSLILDQLLNPMLTDQVLKLLGNKARAVAPLFHNTVSATVVEGGEKINVIPSEIILKLDGRLLPGYTPDNMMTELRQVIGDDVELELLMYEPGPADQDMGLFDTLAGILLQADPGAIPFPLLISASTDARHFSRLGIQTYGFTPMNLPEDFNFFETIHGVNERIPAEAVDFGTSAVYKALQLYQ